MELKLPGTEQPEAPERPSARRTLN
jgi:hypothetical protein